MNQYREGKVKSTPNRGVKEILNPCAYKRSERVAVSGEVNALSAGAEAKASPNRAYSRKRQTRNQVIYPCPG